MCPDPVVGRWLIEGGAVPCLSPVVTDFPEISRKFEGLRLELVSRRSCEFKRCPPSTRRPPTPTSLMAAKVSAPGLCTRTNARATL